MPAMSLTAQFRESLFSILQMEFVTDDKSNVVAFSDSLRAYIEKNYLAQMDNASGFERRDIEATMVKEIVKTRNLEYPCIDKDSCIAFLPKGTLLLKESSLITDGVLALTYPEFYDRFENPLPIYWIDYLHLEYSSDSPEPENGISILASWIPDKYTNIIQDSPDMAIFGNVFTAHNALYDKSQTYPDFAKEIASEFEKEFGFL